MIGRAPAAKTVAVFADPVFGRHDERIALSLQSRLQTASVNGADAQSGPATAARMPSLAEMERAIKERSEPGRGASLVLPRLPFTREEAAAILSVVSPDQAMKSLDFQASREMALSKKLNQYRIIHFATHGLFNSQRPELTGLFFSLINERGEEQNGLVGLDEVYNLDLRSDLVVLSACETALGKEIRGEGLVGLTRGFMYAGSKRVLASLWRVNDVATAELMKRFYQGMFGDRRLSPSAALRQAQVSMWREKRWQQPYYWAAFVLQGEW